MDSLLGSLDDLQGLHHPGHPLAVPNAYLHHRPEPTGLIRGKGANLGFRELVQIPGAKGMAWRQEPSGPVHLEDLTINHKKAGGSPLQSPGYSPNGGSPKEDRQGHQTGKEPENPALGEPGTLFFQRRETGHIGAPS